MGSDGPKESYVRWGSRSPSGKGQFCRIVVAIVKYRDTAVTCRAKTAELIEMLFGLWAWSGSMNHDLDGVQIPHKKGQFWGKRVTH